MKSMTTTRSCVRRTSICAPASRCRLVVKSSGAKEAAAAKAVLERLVADLKEAGTKVSGLQTSGKGAQVRVNPHT